MIYSEKRSDFLVWSTTESTIGKHSPFTFHRNDPSRSKISGALLGSLAARSCDVTSQSVFRQSNDRVAKGISIVDRRMIPLNKTLPRDLCPKESSGRLGRWRGWSCRVTQPSSIRIVRVFFFFCDCARSTFFYLDEDRQARTREQRVAMEPVWWPLTWRAQEM